MNVAQPTRSARIRASLDHPVIDVDGHVIEFLPALMDTLKEVAGPGMVKRYRALFEEEGDPISAGRSWYQLTPEERFDEHTVRPPWWTYPTKNTLDRATAMLPRLLRERLDDMGIDFTVLYPSEVIFFLQVEDDELRRALCRAVNIYHAELYREHSDRMTPAATIPMHTPQEAVEEIEHVVNELGMKAIMIAGNVRRPIPAAARFGPEAARYGYWIDSLGLDSAYDYDPVWAKCVELKVTPTSHSRGQGWGSRTSINNYMYNHIGHFAAAGEAFCKALYMGGVTRRFPSLKFGFLECGAGWAANLYADIVGHWQKRNARVIDNLDPAGIDRALLRDLFERYGKEFVEGRHDLPIEEMALLPAEREVEDKSAIDDWAACGIESEEDIRDVFTKQFYFGCEADDPTNAWAFDTKVNPLGASMQAVFSSDIGHWDVPDMTKVLEEAYELVERDFITEDNFRDFVFTNPATLHGSANPDFFKGTAVEASVDELLVSRSQAAEALPPPEKC